jgi:hypothetical protein
MSYVFPSFSTTTENNNYFSRMVVFGDFIYKRCHKNAGPQQQLVERASSVRMAHPLQLGTSITVVG